MNGRIIVLDVGKTMAKLTLWEQGDLIDRCARQNELSDAGTAAVLDAAGIEAWLIETLRRFAAQGPVRAIIPVAHGAAAAIVRDGRLVVPPVDYEAPIAATDRAAYDRQRDAFARTGSPALPDGLNLGAQLAALETTRPGQLGPGASLLLWPQYWAWLLSGVAASEVTSLGCHTDLWRPGEAKPSALAERRGWAAMLPPLRRAGEALGPIRAEIAEATGLSRETLVYCGLHDSNAALVAARGFPEIADKESTVLSTGTWFVAMRTPAPGTSVDIAALPEARDCLVNVDAYGQPVPSARFMGGREIETLTGIDTRRIDIVPDQPALIAALTAAIASGAMVLPSFAGGFGPFPHARGRWIAMPADEHQRRAIVSLYAALVADVALDLIGSRERLLIEGRFAEAQVFVRALATLRPGTEVYVAHAHNDVSFGALRLIDPTLRPTSRLTRVAPLDLGLDDIRRQWRAAAEQMEQAA